MTALAAQRDTRSLGETAVPRFLRVPVKAAAVIYKGAQVAIDSGYLVPAGANTSLKVVGRSRSNYNNVAGASGDILAEVERGIFVWDNSSTDPLAQADQGNICYAVDDHTVAKTNASGTLPAAGIFQQLEPDGPAVQSFADAGANPTNENPLPPVGIPIVLAAHSNGSIAARFTPGFAGRIKKLTASVVDPVTNGSKLATFTPAIGGVAVTGGALALTSANCTPVGAKVDASAITAANTFTATDEITLVASSVTAFLEGQVVAFLELSDLTE